MHPYESIEVNYVPATKPDHIVERIIVPTDNDPHLRHLFIDGEDTWLWPDGEVERRYGWSNVAKWMDGTKLWKERETAPDKDRYDAIRIAWLRREAAFGPYKGEPSAVTRPFEAWLMDAGWRPVMMDALNAMSPGRVLAKDHSLLCYSHIFAKDDRAISMQFGFGKFNFVFMLSDSPWTYQIPVDGTMFQDAIDGKLQPLEELLGTQQ